MSEVSTASEHRGRNTHTTQTPFARGFHHVYTAYSYMHATLTEVLAETNLVFNLQEGALVNVVVEALGLSSRYIERECEVPRADAS